MLNNILIDTLCLVWSDQEKEVSHPQHFRGLSYNLSAVLPHWNAEDGRTDITQHQPKTAKPNLTKAKKVKIIKFFGTFSSP
jgi:hypothetical protein